MKIFKMKNIQNVNYRFRNRLKRLRIQDVELVVIPEDEKSMADAIIQLVNLPQNELKKMGDNGYEEIKENYSREKLAQKLVGLIEKCK